MLGAFENQIGSEHLSYSFSKKCSSGKILLETFVIQLIQGGIAPNDLFSVLCHH